MRDQAVDLDGVLKAALETAAPALEAHQETIEVATPNQPLWVSGGAVRLAQSIGSLPHNAAKFTSPRGKVRPMMDVSPCVS